MICEATINLLLLALSIAVFSILSAINMVNCTLPNEITAMIWIQLLTYTTSFFLYCACIQCLLKTIKVGFLIPTATLIVSLVLSSVLYKNRDLSCSGDIDYTHAIHTVYYTQGAIFLLNLILIGGSTGCCKFNKSAEKVRYDQL